MWHMHKLLIGCLAKWECSALTDLTVLPILPAHIITVVGVCLQIQTSRQRAIMLVHAYPFITHKDKLVSVLAEQHREPSVQSLLSDITKTDLQHAADWQQAADYLNTITVATMHLHQPLL